MALTFDYYPKVLQVLETISQGTMLTRACDNAGISVSTFEKYVGNDPELANMRADAERRGYDALAEALLDPVGNELVGATSDPKLLNVVSANIKWFLERRASRLYGAKVEVKQEVTVSFAITDALERARQRSVTAIGEAPTPILEDVHFRPVPTEDDKALIAALLR